MDFLLYVGVALGVGLVIFLLTNRRDSDMSAPQDMRCDQVNHPHASETCERYPSQAISHYQNAMCGRQTPYRTEDSFFWGFLAGQILPYPIVFGGPNHMLGMMAAHMMLANHGAPAGGFLYPYGDYTLDAFSDGIRTGTVVIPADYLDGTLDRNALAEAADNAAAIEAGANNQIDSSDWGDTQPMPDAGDAWTPSCDAMSDGVVASQPDPSPSYDAPSPTCDPGPSYDAPSPTYDPGPSSSSCDFGGSSSIDTGSSW